MNVAFFGTSDRSIPILNSLKESNFDLVLCVTKNDMTVGRKKELKPTGVKVWAEENRVQVVTMGKFNTLSKRYIREYILNNNIELCVVADFSFMIPGDIFTLPKHGFVNIHFSLLPLYRGASPVQFTILNQDEISGITYQQLVKGMDEGDIISQSVHKLNGIETTDSLYTRLFEQAGKELPGVLEGYISGDILPQEQNHKEATYTYSPSHPNNTHIFKEDAKINWTKSPKKLDAMVRAFNPWPIAWTTLKELAEYVDKPLSEGKKSNTTVKILDTKIEKDKLAIKTLQVAGKNKTDWNSFENGYLLN